MSNNDKNPNAQSMNSPSQSPKARAIMEGLIVDHEAMDMLSAFRLVLAHKVYEEAGKAMEDRTAPREKSATLYGCALGIASSAGYCTLTDIDSAMKAEDLLVSSVSTVSTVIGAERTRELMAESLDDLGAPEELVSDLMEE